MGINADLSGVSLKKLEFNISMCLRRDCSVLAPSYGVCNLTEYSEHFSICDLYIAGNLPPSLLDRLLSFFSALSVGVSE